MTSHRSILLLVPLLAASLAPLAAQAENGRPTTAEVLAKADPEARAAWEKLCRASLGEVDAPITAFHLEAQTRLRDGVQRNDARIAYRFLAPDLVRFSLESKRELGRFGKDREEHWMKDGSEVITLADRTYKSDRRTIEEMAILARNYIALSAPDRLTITAIESLPGHPPEVMRARRREARKLQWLTVESPNFALLGSSDAGKPQESYRIDFGLRRADTDGSSTSARGPAWTPAMAVVRGRPAPGRPAPTPVLLLLGDYRHQDGFHIPFHLSIHQLDPRTGEFDELAAQDAKILQANLRPKLTKADFEP